MQMQKFAVLMEAPDTRKLSLTSVIAFCPFLSDFHFPVSPAPPSSFYPSLRCEPLCCFKYKDKGFDFASLQPLKHYNLVCDFVSLQFTFLTNRLPLSPWTDI